MKSLKVKQKIRYSLGIAVALVSFSFGLIILQTYGQPQSPILRPGGVLRGYSVESLYRGPYVVKFRDGDRVLGVRLATDKKGNDVIHIYEISYLDDIHVKELPIEEGEAIEFRTQGRDYKYWVTYTVGKILINIRGRETHTYDLDGLYNVRFGTGITDGYAAEIGEGDEKKVFYVSPQGGAVPAILLWGVEEANRVWTGLGVVPQVNPRSLKPKHVVFLDESKGESNMFVVNGVKYKFKFKTERLGGVWELVQPISSTEPDWDTVEISHGGGRYEGPKVWAGVKIRSEPPGAHVYGMDGSYWGETGEDRETGRVRYVYRRLWVVSDRPTSKEYTVTLKKPGYRETKHSWIVRYEDKLMAAHRYEELVIVLEP